MKINFLKNNLAGLLLILFAAVFVAGSFVPYAHAAAKPSIKDISKKTSTSLTVTVKYKTWAKKKVKVTVIVDVDKTKKNFKKFTSNETLNKDGEEDIKIFGLKPDTKYRIKVKMKRRSGGSWTKYSDVKKVTTEKSD